MKTPTFVLLLHHLFLVPVFIQCDDNLIDQICKKTPFHDLCISSLKPNAKGSATDVKGLARVMVDIVLRNATDNLKYIQGLVKQASDTQQERALAKCTEVYIPVVRFELPQAIKALSMGHYGFAKHGIANVGKQADACERGFAKSPSADRDKLVHSLADIAVATINILAKL